MYYTVIAHWFEVALRAPRVIGVIKAQGDSLKVF